MLTLLADAIDDDPLNRIFATWKMAEDSHVQVYWNPATPLGKIGELLDDASDQDAECHRPTAAKRAAAQALRAKAQTVAGKLSKEDLELALLVAPAELRQFIVINVGAR